MSEMVERVARAITEAFDREGRVFDEGQADTLARAAIEAMREPTEGMWDACEKEQAEFETGIGWSVMIDAALKGTATVDWDQTVVVFGDALK